MEENLHQRLQILEAENRRLREREADAETTIRTLIEKLPTAAVALDATMRVLYANGAFVELLDYDARQMIDLLPNMQGIELRNIVSEPVYELIEGVHSSGQDAPRHLIRVPAEGEYSISVFNIRRSELTIALVYNLNNPEIRTTEIVSRLTATIDRNMRMIQNIAFLLGEEVSENAKEIGAVIKTLQSTNER